ncbi:MAG: LD-carboxypeptidase [Desulfatiglandaceae bacterium]
MRTSGHQDKKEEAGTIHPNRMTGTYKGAPMKPRALHHGDGVGIISPAGPVSEDQLAAGIKRLESSGFKVHTGPHVYAKSNYLAGEDSLRLADFHAMFLNSEIKAVFCSRGGYGSLRLLDRIDYDLVRKHPKLLIGFSDITALLMALYKHSGLVTFHGPMVVNLSSIRTASWTHFHRLLSEGGPVTIPCSQGKVLSKGRAVGPLLGGNMSLICHLIGTPFFPSLHGAILFLEDRGEPPYRLDRMLTHLAQAGELQDLAGVVAGRFVDCGGMTAFHGLLEARFAGTDVPVVTGFPLGHGSDNLALPMGIRAELDTDRMTLRTMEPHVL